jgi:hypothetical protein
MGVPLQKLRVVANDFQRPLTISPPRPRVVTYIRLAPTKPLRRNFSWAAVIAYLFLGGMIFMFGVVIGTAFWFTYDGRAAVESIEQPRVTSISSETPLSSSQSAPILTPLLFSPPSSLLNAPEPEAVGPMDTRLPAEALAPFFSAGFRDGYGFGKDRCSACRRSFH